MKYLLSITLLFSSFLPLQAAFTVCITQTSSTEAYRKLLETDYLDIRANLPDGVRDQAPEDVCKGDVNKVQTKVLKDRQPAFIIIPSDLDETMFGRDLPHLDRKPYHSSDPDCRVTLITEGEDGPIMVLYLSNRFLSRLGREPKHSGAALSELSSYLTRFTDIVSKWSTGTVDWYLPGRAAPLSTHPTPVRVFLSSPPDEPRPAELSQLYHDALGKMTKNTDVLSLVTTESEHEWNGDLFQQTIAHYRGPTVIIISSEDPVTVDKKRMYPMDIVGEHFSEGLLHIEGKSVWVLVLTPRIVSEKPPKLIQMVAEGLDWFVDEAKPPTQKSKWTRRLNS